MRANILTALLALLMSFPLMAQTKISGVVKDNIGPLVGVSVIEQGTTNGAVTPVK